MAIRSTVSRRNVIGSRTSSVFPGEVVGEGGITIEKSGNTTTIGFDLSTTELEAELQDGIAAAAASADASAASATTASGYAIDAAASAEASAAVSAEVSAAVAGIIRGRLSLASGVAVTSSDISDATTMYYVPASGSQVPVWNGTGFTVSTYSELSLVLDSNSGHTGYHQSGKNFDLFAILDGVTPLLATGPAWASNTSRGTGAGTTELVQTSGIWTNKYELTAARYGDSSGDTVSVLANRATYLGSFRATANGRATDSASRRLLFNAYNPAMRSFYLGRGISDTSFTGASLDYTTNGYIGILCGLDNVIVDVRAQTSFLNITSTATTYIIQILAIDIADPSTIDIFASLDTDGVYHGGYSGATNGAANTTFTAYCDAPGFGYHEIYWHLQYDGTGGSDTTYVSSEGWSRLTGSVLL